MPGFFVAMDKIKPVYDVVDAVVLFICKILLIVDIVLAIYAVLGRYIPGLIPPIWGEEIILTMMSYMAVLSAALAIRRGAHIRMTIFDNVLPKKVIIVLDIVADVAVLVLAYYMITAGWEYTTTLGARAKYVTLPSLSKFWMYLPVPLAGVAMVVFEVEAIYQHIRKLFVKEEGGEA